MFVDFGIDGGSQLIREIASFDEDQKSCRAESGQAAEAIGNRKGQGLVWRISGHLFAAGLGLLGLSWAVLYT